MGSGLHRKTRTRTCLPEHTHCHVHVRLHICTPVQTCTFPHVCSCTYMGPSSSDGSLGFTGIGSACESLGRQTPTGGSNFPLLLPYAISHNTRIPDCSGPSVDSFCSKSVKSLRPGMYAVSCADFWLILSSVDE